MKPEPPKCANCGERLTWSRMRQIAGVGREIGLDVLLSIVTDTPVSGNVNPPRANVKCSKCGKKNRV